MNESDAPQKTLSEIIEAASSTESVQSNKIVGSNVPGNCGAVIEYEITQLLNVNSLRRFLEERAAITYRNVLKNEINYVRMLIINF